MRRIYLLSYIALISQVLLSQHYLPIKKFTVDNGLSHSEITYLFQDKSGFLWIGTKNGLNRYDGYTFTKYTSDINDNTTLSGNYIIKIFEDAQNNLWLVSTQGISRYVKKNDKFKTYYLFNDEAKNHASIKLHDADIDWKRNTILLSGDNFLGKFDINTDSVIGLSIKDYNLDITDIRPLSLSYNGLYNTFFLFGTQSLLRFDTETDSLYSISSETIRNLSGYGGIKGLMNAINGECLVYTHNRIFIFEDLTSLREIDIHPFLEDKEIVTILQHQPELLSIVTTSSVIEYNFIEKAAKEMFTYSISGESHIYHTAALFMQPGIFWFGTRNGLFKFNDHRNFFNEHATNEYFSENSELTALAFDETGLLWLGCSTGELIVLNPAQGKQDVPVVARLKSSKKITSLKINESGDVLFMGTEDGLFNLKLINGTNILKKIIIPGSIEAFCRNHDTLWIAKEEQLYIASTNNTFSTTSRNMEDVLHGMVIDMFSFRDAVYLLQSNQIIRHSKGDSSNIILSLAQLNLNILPENTCFLPLDEMELITGTTFGLYIYYLYDFKILPSYLNIEKLTEPVHALYQNHDQNLWITSNSGISKLNMSINEVRTYSRSDGLIPASYTGGIIDKNSKGMMCVAGKDCFVLFNADSIPVNQNAPKIEITGIELYQRGRSKKIPVSGIDTVNLETKYNHVLFSFAALDYWDPSKNTFQYSLQRAGKPDNWVYLGTNNSFHNPIHFKIGDYKLKIKGANNDGIWCMEPRELVIHMVAPWWRSRIAIVSYLVIIALLFYLILLFTTQQLRRVNKQYREREFISRKVEMQKEELTTKNKNITDSINYAKRIQMALMPSQKLFKKFFPDSFILHMPKDIVSGDFYWVNQVNGRIYFAAVDCTGHGVPGAFMSIIGFELFRRITEIEKKRQPAEILKSLNQGFETIFRDIEDIVLRDGMDVAFCAVDPKLKVLEFAGAFNPLYIVRDNSITEIKGDRFSVGLNQLDLPIPDQPFNDHVVPLKDGDIIYIFTDGYADQFGGPDGKKYKYRRFRHLLLALHQLPMERQVEFLRRSIMDWKGDLDQVDDILVMGIRISHNKHS